jgi:8-oxo-dGTP pyrophosphatase MutT (NUDIX family)
MAEIIRQRENNEPYLLPYGDAEIVFEGKLGAIVDFPVLVDEGNGYVLKKFQRFVRPPGTRIIAKKGNIIFLQKERRLETNNGFDWRLPGGKVLDTWNEYKQYLNKDIPEDIILTAAAKELREEAGLSSGKLSLYRKSSCGASVTWDLYYVIGEEVTEETRTTVEAEEIVDGKWFSFEEITNMIKNKEIDEDRTIAILLQLILEEKN